MSGSHSPEKKSYGIIREDSNRTDALPVTCIQCQSICYMMSRQNHRMCSAVTASTLMMLWDPKKRLETWWYSLFQHVICPPFSCHILFNLAVKSMWLSLSSINHSVALKYLLFLLVKLIVIIAVLHFPLTQQCLAHSELSFTIITLHIPDASFHSLCALQLIKYKLTVIVYWALHCTAPWYLTNLLCYNAHLPLRTRLRYPLPDVLLSTLHDSSLPATVHSLLLDLICGTVCLVTDNISLKTEMSLIPIITPGLQNYCHNGL